MLEQWKSKLKLKLQSKEPIPKLVLIFQGIAAAVVLLYILMIIGGGIFTTYYSWLAACAFCGIATLVTLIKKRWYIASIDLAVTVLVFLSLFALPF